MAIDVGTLIDAALRARVGSQRGKIEERERQARERRGALADLLTQERLESERVQREGSQTRTRIAEEQLRRLQASKEGAAGMLEFSISQLEPEMQEQIRAAVASGQLTPEQALQEVQFQRERSMQLEDDERRFQHQQQLRSEPEPDEEDEEKAQAGFVRSRVAQLIQGGLVNTVEEAVAQANQEYELSKPGALGERQRATEQELFKRGTATQRAIESLSDQDATVARNTVAAVVTGELTARQAVDELERYAEDQGLTLEQQEALVTLFQREMRNRR